MSAYAETKTLGMGYAAQLNRCVLGYKSSHILPKRWHDLLPYYDAEHARQLGTRHPQDLIVRVRMLETRWYHTRTNMYRFLYLAGLVSCQNLPSESIIDCHLGN